MHEQQDLPRDLKVLHELQLDDDQGRGGERLWQAAQRAARRDRVRVGEAGLGAAAQHDHVPGEGWGEG